jgi:SPP1 family predicted phage head-tail adaptor
MLAPRLNPDPGRYDRRVEIQNRTDTRDAFGAPVPVWSTVARPWGEWFPTPGRETVAAGQLQPLQTGILKIRGYREDITAASRVLLSGVAFELIAPPVELGRRWGLELSLRSLSPAPVSP